MTSAIVGARVGHGSVSARGFLSLPPASSASEAERRQEAERDQLDYTKGRIRHEKISCIESTVPGVARVSNPRAREVNYGHHYPSDYSSGRAGPRWGRIRIFSLAPLGYPWAS